jgi:hypothetical protein
MPARTALHLSEKLVFRKLPEDSVFGNPASHCAGLLTFEHQGCPEFEREFSRFGLPKSKQEEGRNAIAHYRGPRLLWRVLDWTRRAIQRAEPGRG